MRGGPVIKGSAKMVTGKSLSRVTVAGPIPGGRSEPTLYRARWFFAAYGASALLDGIFDCVVMGVDHVTTITFPNFDQRQFSSVQEH